MPRPGPRPYECVRRAWHSDRHQPIRGSLIQELFRIVNEVHSLATRKNKEWQEKLPVVVLKAEEIMYSKANSEAEYVDFNTLWGRANDAIHTIIRRDESTETGELLQPCIEAALHLGCTPRRSSRSQRNNTPRCYLNPERPENLENKAQGNYGINCSLIPQSSKLLTSNTMSSSNACINLDTSVPSSCSVYPLYYGDQFYFNDPIVKNSSIRKADKEDVMEKHSSCGVNGAKVLFQTHSRPISETPPGSGCDLSLRLGPLGVSCLGSENTWPQEVERVACKVGTKPSDGSFLQCDDSFSRGNAHGVLDSCSPAKWNHHHVAQNPIVEPSLRKRKAAGVSHPSEDRQLCWPLKRQFKQFN